MQWFRCPKLHRQWQNSYFAVLKRYEGCLYIVIFSQPPKLIKIIQLITLWFISRTPFSIASFCKEKQPNKTFTFQLIMQNEYLNGHSRKHSHAHALKNLIWCCSLTHIFLWLNRGNVSDIIWLKSQFNNHQRVLMN